MDHGAHVMCWCLDAETERFQLLPVGWAGPDPCLSASVRFTQVKKTLRMANMQIAEGLGLQLPMPEVLALFSHHGYTTFIMPLVAFQDLVLPSSAAKATAEAPAKRRPFAAGGAPSAVAPSAPSKITYWPCKTPVFTPSRWPQIGQQAIQRSARVPDARLRLEFVYGYAGFNTTSCNLFYNCNRQVRPFPECNCDIVVC